MKYYTAFRPMINTYDYAKQVLEMGVSGLEAVYWESYLSPEVNRDYLDTIKRIKGEFGTGFTVHAPIKDIHLGSTNRKIREVSLAELREALDFAIVIGASLVVIHAAPGLAAMPGGEWSKRTPSPAKTSDALSEEEALLVEAVQTLADSAPNLLLGLENLVYPHELYRSPEELLDLIRKVNRSNVGLTLDVGHAQVCGYGASDFINLLGDDLLHVHLHDNHGVIDEHLPLGQGIVDYLGVIQSLKKLDYQGVVNLEFSAKNPQDYRRYLLEFK